MTRRIQILLAGLGILLGIALPAAAYAGEDDNHHPGPRAGAACAPRWKVGDELTINTRNGPRTYRCEQRAGDPCPVWHWVYDPSVPKGQKKPQGCPQCPSSPPPPPPSSPSPSVSASSGPPASSTPSVSTSPAPALPVTGSSAPPTGRIALIGLAAVAGGGVLMWLAYWWPRRRPGRAG